MRRKVFRFTNGYDYDELSRMCDSFREVKLPFSGKYDVNRLLSSYIFCSAMDRIPIGLRHTIRRMLGGLFIYPLKAEDRKKNVFLFTGDGKGRADYLYGIHSVARQCPDACVCTMDREHPKLRLSHLFSIFLELIWALKFNRIVEDLNTSMDMAAWVYRASKQGEYIYENIKDAERMITFCDSWEIESVVTQLAIRDGLPTATLQHGNGTEIMYGSCSDYYLANSKLSVENCLHAGIPKEKIFLAGGMKYAGEAFEYKKFDRIHSIGIVFDGAQNFENNVEMLQIVHEALKGKAIKSFIRFHPNNRRQDYQPYLLDTDVICDDLAEFERSIDICIVYNSSMYTDMIYKKTLTYRYKNGRVDLYPMLHDEGFSNADELGRIIAMIASCHDKCVQKQNEIYDCIFGKECDASSYRSFFEGVFNTKKRRGKE